MLPDWLYYELQIHQLLSYEYPTAAVLHDFSIKGRESQRKRQIDVIIFKGKRKSNFGIAECKYLTDKNISITKIDEMIGKMKDVGAKFGILVTTGSYSKPAKRLADCNSIVIKTIPYEFLKDYGFQTANQLGDISEYIQQEVEYPTCYCKKCDKTNLYEVKIIRGLADFGRVVCPECGKKLIETRLDGDYRVIKRFPGNSIPDDEINYVIALHMLWTRASWDRMFSLDSILSDGMKVKPGCNCSICRKYFEDHVPGSMKHTYKRKQICVECFMSGRTLLIDLGIKAPTFRDYFSTFMADKDEWKAFKIKLFEHNARFFQ